MLYNRDRIGIVNNPITNSLLVDSAHLTDAAPPPPPPEDALLNNNDGVLLNNNGAVLLNNFTEE